MTSSRPYLIRALYEWIVDNGLTPHLLINASVEGVQVPGEYVRDGKIVLNVSPSATDRLMIENEFLHFSARFGGRPIDIHLPIRAVLAIYARENGQGMAFGDDEPEPPPEGPDGGDGPEADGDKRPRLKVVK